MAAASYSLTRRLLQTGGGRDLFLDDTHRGISASITAHGQRPNRHENLASRFLGVNYVLRGRGVYIDADGVSTELSPGTLFHRYPAIVHTTRFDPASDYTEFHIVFDGGTGNQLRRLGIIPPKAVMQVGIDPVLLDEFTHLVKCLRMHEMQFSSRDMLHETIGFLNRLYQRDSDLRKLGFWERVIRDARLMLAHNKDERLHLETIAGQLGVSYAALRKNFTRAVGMSPNEFRIQRRLEESRVTLLHHSVKEVARTLGYCDAFSFSRQFKRYIGISPREFQRRNRCS